MASVTETWITCDNCTKPFGLDSRNRAIGQHRTAAKSEGWSINNHHDLCPGCKPVKKPVDAKRKISKIKKGTFDADGYNKEFMRY